MKGIKTMNEFLKAKREQADNIYNSKKPYYEEKLKTAISASAEKGNRTTVINIQGTSEPFERYLQELGLECINKSYNYSWVCYVIKW